IYDSVNNILDNQLCMRDIFSYYVFFHNNNFGFVCLLYKNKKVGSSKLFFYILTPLFNKKNPDLSGFGNLKKEFILCRICNNRVNCCNFLLLLSRLWYRVRLSQ